MLRTIDDFISLFVLVALSFFTVRFFVGSFFNSNRDDAVLYKSKHELLSDYLNNEEE